MNPTFKISGAVICAFLMTGCVTAPTDANGSPLPRVRQLAGAEIIELIAGRSQTFALEPDVVTSRYFEFYAPAGVLSIATDRAAAGGTWRLVGDDICIRSSPSDQEECRAYYVSNDGRLYVVRQTPSSTTGAFIQVLVN